MKRKKYSKNLKSNIEIAAEFGIYVSQVNRWKRAAIEDLPDIVGGNQARTIKAMEAEGDRLFQQIGKLQVEQDWLRKQPGI